MAKEAKKKTKRPTAEKRQIQNEKRRIINKSFKSEIRSAVRGFEEALKGEDKEVINERLNTAYSLMDKSVKRGIYKLNKSSRTKARLAAKAAAKS